MILSIYATRYETTTRKVCCEIYIVITMTHIAIWRLQRIILPIQNCTRSLWAIFLTWQHFGTTIYATLARCLKNENHFAFQAGEIQVLAVKEEEVLQFHVDYNR